MTDKLLFFAGAITLLLLALLCLWLPLRRRVSGKWLVLWLVIPVLAVVLYCHWGSPKALFGYWHQQQEHKLALQYLKQQKNPLDIVSQLEQHLQQQPNQPKGWYLLGNIYVKQNKLQAAFDAYQQAYHYEAKLEYLIALCQMDLSLHRKMSDQNRKAMQAVFKDNSNNLSVMSLLAFDAFSQKRYSHAIQLWRHILSKLPAQSKEAKQVLGMIARAQDDTSPSLRT